MEKIEYIAFFPLASFFVMLAASIAFYRLRTVTGYYIMFISLLTAGWSLFLFLEYTYQRACIQSVSAIGIQPWCRTPSSAELKLYSTVAGIFGEMIPFLLLLFSLHFPPTTNRIHIWFPAVLIGGILLSCCAYFGLNIEMRDNQIIRTPSPLFYIQFGGFIGAVLSSFIILGRKHQNYTSIARRHQIQYIAGGVILSCTFGGVYAFLFPADYTMVMVASLAPLIFTTSALIGMIKTKLNHRKHALHYVDFFKSLDNQIIDNPENDLRRRSTLYSRTADSTSYSEWHGNEVLRIPNTVDRILLRQKALFLDDYNDQIQSEVHTFLRQNYAYSAAYYQGKARQYLLIVHEDR
ncbi:MAG: hypothetical protein KDK30_16200 [Leptospiraceae bacterium]|nr:hypothetical protein [Leptospiraceae bacterium]